MTDNGMYNPEFPVAGGLIHLLLVIAIVVVLVRLITGRRVV